MSRQGGRTPVERRVSDITFPDDVGIGMQEECGTPRPEAHEKHCCPKQPLSPGPGSLLPRPASRGRVISAGQKAKPARWADADMSLKNILSDRPMSRNGGRAALSTKHRALSATPDSSAYQHDAMMPYLGPPAVTTAIQGVADVEECLTWTRPRQMTGGFVSSLARLGVQIDQQSREWHAQRRPREVVEDMPLDPMHTAEAASLLLRVVRSLPSRLPLRTMLEPLAQVLLRSVYCDWAWVPSLDGCEEESISVHTLLQWVPFYTLVKGHQGLTETFKVEASAAVAEAQSLRSTTATAVKEFAVEQARAAAFEEKYLAQAQALSERDEAYRSLMDAYRKLQNDLRTQQSDFAEIQNSHHEAKQDLRDMQRDILTKDKDIADLRGQVQKHTASNATLGDENYTMRAQLLQQKAAMDQLPGLKDKVEVFESAEAIHGISFAVRISKEVLGKDLQEICGMSEAQLTRRTSHPNGATQRTAQMKAVLDTISNKLKALPMEIAQFRTAAQEHHQQLKEYRQLIPIWNQDAMEDLDDAYNQDAPVHRQVFSMKDRRSFAGLGTDSDVPPYLRAEGLVRHVFVSKAELEVFMQGFKDHFLDPAAEHEMTTESMHTELYHHMRQRFHHKDQEHPETALSEFAYAFICGLEAYRSDPDFELFDLMLSGAVHPDIMKDQQDMLHNIAGLMKECQEASGVPDEDKGRRKGGGEKKEQVSRRVIRAVLGAVFTDKQPARQDSLRQALFVTMQMLSDAGKTPHPDYVYTGDLFADTADGSQTPLVEEIRRQHVYEIIEWTCELSRRLLSGRSLRDGATTTTEKDLHSIITNLDPHTSQADASKLSRIGCPAGDQEAHVRNVLQRLRHGVLLRPKRLWVRCESKEVVKGLLEIAHSGGGMESARNSLMIEMPGSHSQRRSSHRVRAVKVLDNPVQNMNSDVYNDPDTLEKVVIKQTD